MNVGERGAIDIERDGEGVSILLHDDEDDIAVARLSREQFEKLRRAIQQLE